jgi:predicted nuclease with TOPRIM domain
MEQRNDAMKGTSEQIGRQLKEMIEEKTKLENELNDAERKYSTLNRSYSSLKSQFEASEVRGYQTF